MAFAALSSVFSTGTLLAAPVTTALSLIPLLALGINYYRYLSVDPEGRPIDAQKVNFWKCLKNAHFIICIIRKFVISLFQIRVQYDFIVVGAGKWNFLNMKNVIDYMNNNNA